jgi:quinolinate synthase
MKRNTLEKVLWSLEELRPEVRVPEEIRVRARRALEAMVAVKVTSAASQAGAQRTPVG